LSAKYFAHVRQSHDGKWQIHDLPDHCLSVAKISESSLTLPGKPAIKELAFLAGLWHDLGKLREAFQERIKKLSGFEALEAHIENKPGRVDHSTAGGIFALERLGDALGVLVAFPILGHHTGLQDKARVLERIAEGRDEHKFLEEIRDRITPEFLQEYSGAEIAGFRRGGLLIRMLFSALVDADFLDTARFMQPDRLVPPVYDLRDLDIKLDAHLETLQAGQTSDVNIQRKKILAHIQSGAQLDPGFFTLTVPTGGGKTLASLSFALKHALLHGKRRIIYVVPYTSIIEQTADVFRDILGPDAVLEHHSNIDPADARRENPLSRIRAENWGAPIVVTTNVQFFESLFARRTSRCRKLHSMIDAVVIFDEAQQLPPDFLVPIVGALRELVSAYGVSAVLCTATQPALESEVYGTTRFEGIDDARELAPDPANLYCNFERVRLHVPADFDYDSRPTHDVIWPEIADRIRPHPSVLTIVNLRADARRLAGLLPDAYHLSTNLCGAHRKQALDEIRARLKKKESVQVVSTQLIEAGVDVDFPVVFRALTGLDSIAQAAGRCNREGLLTRGDVYVFIAPSVLPPGHLLQAEQAGRRILERGEIDLRPELFREYFRELYFSKESLDTKEIESLERRLNFEQVADAFRMIPPSQSIIVPFGDEGRRVIDRLHQPELTRADYRAVRRFAVNVLESDLKKLIAAGSVETIQDTFHILSNKDLYDERFGLRLEDPMYHTEHTLVI
jgi:CRISPR-associated endonuclease/helicase Cas3